MTALLVRALACVANVVAVPVAGAPRPLRSHPESELASQTQSTTLNEQYFDRATQVLDTRSGKFCMGVCLFCVCALLSPLCTRRETHRRLRQTPKTSPKIVVCVRGYGRRCCALVWRMGFCARSSSARDPSTCTTQSCDVGTKRQLHLHTCDPHSSSS